MLYLTGCVLYFLPISGIFIFIYSVSDLSYSIFYFQQLHKNTLINFAPSLMFSEAVFI